MSTMNTPSPAPPAPKTCARNSTPPETCARNSTPPKTCARNSTPPETCGRNSTLFAPKTCGRNSTLFAGSPPAAPPEALEALSAGGVAIIATDTVYGLAALPGSPGEQRIYDLKQRPADQPLAWLVSGPASLDELATDVSDEARELAATRWPGALTLVLRAAPQDPASHQELSVPRDTIALRCPDDAGCLALIEALGSPLACTSANIHARPAPSRRCDIDPVFVALPGYGELPPETPSERASTVLDCTQTPPKVLRP